MGARACRTSLPIDISLESSTSGAGKGRPLLHLCLEPYLAFFRGASFIHHLVPLRRLAAFCAATQVLVKNFSSVKKPNQ